MELSPFRAKSFFNSELPLLNKFDDIQREIDRTIQSLSMSPIARELDYPRMGFFPSVDVKENEEAYFIEADLPGLDDDDIDLEVHDNMLTIKGNKKAANADADAHYNLCERNYGAFKRNIPFDEELNSEQVEAKLEDGVLRIELKKKDREKRAHRKIEIKS